MDSKTKHRLLIFLVAIGLVVILLPLFQGGNDVSTKTKLVKAPEFPDESVRAVSDVPQSAVISVKASDADIDDVLASTGSVLDDDPSETLDLDFGADDTADVAAKSDAKAKPAKLDTAKTQAAEVKAHNVAATKPATEKAETHKAAATAKLASAKAVSHESKQAKAHKKIAGVVKKLAHGKHALVIKEPTKNERALIKASKVAWAVQVGTFRNKDNAFRLLNKLRAKGYKAFVHKMSDSSRFASRVYVGPSTNKGDAKQLASRLHGDFNLDVLVVNYKPLAL